MMITVLDAETIKWLKLSHNDWSLKETKYNILFHVL